MSFHFDPDPGFKRELVKSDEVGFVVDGLAEQVADRARGRAPDDPRTTGSSIAEGIVVDRGVERGRRIARVNATDWKSHFPEYGTSRHHATPYLRPSAEEVVGPLEGEEAGDD